VVAHDSIDPGSASFLVYSHGHEDKPGLQEHGTPVKQKGRWTSRLFFSHAQVLAVIGLASDGTAPAFPGQAVKPHPPQRDLTRALICFLNAPFPHHACTLYFLHAPSEAALAAWSIVPAITSRNVRPQSTRSHKVSPLTGQD